MHIRSKLVHVGVRIGTQARVCVLEVGQRRVPFPI